MVSCGDVKVGGDDGSGRMIASSLIAASSAEEVEEAFWDLRRGRWERVWVVLRRRAVQMQW